jgi:GTP-binding protein
MIIVVNKWDAVIKDEKTMNRFDREIREEFGFIHYAPILYISALTGQRVNKILEIVDFVAEQQNLRISTARLNEVVNEALAITPLLLIKESAKNILCYPNWGKASKIHFIRQ